MNHDDVVRAIGRVEGRMERLEDEDRADAIELSRRTKLIFQEMAAMREEIGRLKGQTQKPSEAAQTALKGFWEWIGVRGVLVLVGALGAALGLWKVDVFAIALAALWGTVPAE